MLLQQIVQCRDVRLCHLKRFIFRELPIVTQRRKIRSQSIECFIQVLHSSPFSGVRRQSAFPHDRRANVFTSPSHHVSIVPVSIDLGSYVIGTVAHFGIVLAVSVYDSV